MLNSKYLAILFFSTIQVEASPIISERSQNRKGMSFGDCESPFMRVVKFGVGRNPSKAVGYCSSVLNPSTITIKETTTSTYFVTSTVNGITTTTEALGSVTVSVTKTEATVTVTESGDGSKGTSYTHSISTPTATGLQKRSFGWGSNKKNSQMTTGFRFNGPVASHLCSCILGPSPSITQTSTSVTSITTTVTKVSVSTTKLPVVTGTVTQTITPKTTTTLNTGATTTVTANYLPRYITKDCVYSVGATYISIDKNIGTADNQYYGLQDQCAAICDKKADCVTWFAYVEQNPNANGEVGKCLPGTAEFNNDQVTCPVPNVVFSIGYYKT